YKLMGMAPYGRDRDAERIADKLEGLFTYTDARWELKTPVWNLNSDERLVYESLREMFEFERFDNICAGLQLSLRDSLSGSFRIGFAKQVLGESLFLAGSS
ncbi:MAG TPA: hypothetical protein PLB73_05780, partial [Leptospiraceae bacterium]|nr:hypothetical protein [Leptospiraceae bacterium]